MSGSRRFLYLRLLRSSLVLGSLYDIAFAALMVAAPAATARLLRLPLPAERFYLDLVAVLLVMLAALYLGAARDPRRLSAVVGLALAAAGRPDLATLWWLASADFAFAVAHAAGWLPLRE